MTATAGAERVHRVTTADGIGLHALLAAPARPRAAIVLCHGLTTDSEEHGAFPRLRDLALRAGLAVVRYDARAHGRSEGKNEDLRLAGVRADADAIAGLIDAELGSSLPVIPLGVSFGGGAAVHLAASRAPCAGLALWYAVIDYEWTYGPESPVPFTSMMREAMGPGDPAWAALKVADSGYYIPTGLMEELPGDTTAETLGSLDVPVLALHGSRDALVDVTPIRRIAAARPNVRLRIAWGAGHGFWLWRPWVLRETARWMARAADPTRSARRRRPARAR
ncbi:MAG: alpha/beta hydrolase [Solirubrobacteraceae bacterium]